jgi:hypothetical protein
MKFKNKIIILGILAFYFILATPSVFASTTEGSIDSTYRYAWGENVGFIDFGGTSGNVVITDTAITGYAYGENIGFINLTGIINDNEGDLSGYAWGENVGWVDFSNTSIGIDGVFSGYAYGENIGFITFGLDTNKVATDWRPASTRQSSSPRRSSGSTPMVTTLVPNVQIIPTTPSTPNIQTPTIIRILKLTKPQMQGDDVKSLQTYLNAHNYNCGIIDGIFGNLTKQAVIKFQLANQLVGDGIVGPLTRVLLK